MTMPKTSTQIGLPTCWKVRVVIHGALLHFVSGTEPIVRAVGSDIESIEWTPIINTEHGDHPGFIRWRDVSAVTWRIAN